MQFRLRTLMIVLAIGPPLLAIAWTNREYLQSSRYDPAIYIPRDLTPGADATARKQLASVRTLHFVAGAGAVVLFPVAIMLQWAVLSRWRNWRQPPKQTPLAWAAFAAALLAGTFVLVFFLTIVGPLWFSVEDFTSPDQYHSWKNDL